MLLRRHKQKEQAKPLSEKIVAKPTEVKASGRKPKK